MPLSFYRGDVDRNGAITMTDLLFLKAWLQLGGSADNLRVISPTGVEYNIPSIEYGDLNRSGNITYADLQYLEIWLGLGGSITSNPPVLSVTSAQGITYTTEAIYDEPEPEPEPEPESLPSIYFSTKEYVIDIDSIEKTTMEVTVNAPVISDNIVDSEIHWSGSTHTPENNWININQNFTTFFNVGITQITWTVYDIYGNELSDYVTINIIDVFGPKIGNVEHDFIENYEFTINSHTNIYSGQINVPNAYDVVDGWLDKIKYKVNQYGEWIEIDTDVSGSILNLDFKHDTTIIYWNAIDSANRESIHNSNARTIVIVRDNHGPYLENFIDDITVHSNEVNTQLYADRTDEVQFKIIDNKNTFNGAISIPKAYDAVDNWLTRAYYKIDVSGQWESIPVWPGELILDWPYGITTVYWKATDYNNNDSINSVRTIVTVIDSYGPIFVNAVGAGASTADPTLNINNYFYDSITSYTRYKTLSIPLPKAYDAVDGEIYTYEYYITGGTASPQSGISNTALDIEFKLEWQNYIDDGSGSKCQEFTIEWRCKDSDLNYAQNFSTTTIQIKDEYGPILFFHDSSNHVDNDLSNHIDGQHAENIQVISTEHSKNYAILHIKRPLAFDNVYGQIHDLTFTIEPSIDVNIPTGIVAYGSPGPHIKFSLDPHKIVTNTKYQEFTINWHTIDKSNNPPANTGVTYVRLEDNEIPNFVDSSGTYLIVEQVEGILEGGKNSTILDINRPYVTDAVDGDILNIQFVIDKGTGDAIPLDAADVDVSGGILSGSSMQVEFVVNQYSIIAGTKYMMFSITWSVTDTAGNIVSVIQDIFVYNYIKPYIIGDLPTIHKNTDNNNPVHIKVPRPAVGDNVDTYIRTEYIFKEGEVRDSSGGLLPGQTFTDISYEYDASDALGIDMFFHADGDKMDANTKEQEFIIEWKAIDSASNISETKLQSIIITDNKGPYFDVNSISDITQELNSHNNQILISVPVPTAYDAVDGSISEFSFVVSGGIVSPDAGSTTATNIDILFTIETDLLYSEQTSPKYQTFTIDWHTVDRFGFTEENQVYTNIKIIDNYGPLIGGVSEDYIIDESYSFVDESYEYTGQISIPNVNDAVDGWLNVISYRKSVNGVSGNVIDVDTDSSGTKVLQETWVEGVTEYEWIAKDDTENYNENIVTTRITIIDERPANISEEEVWFNKYHQNNDMPNFQGTYPSIHDRYDASGGNSQFYFWETNKYDPTKTIDSSEKYTNTYTDYDNLYKNPNGEVSILGNWINYRNYIPKGYYENSLPIGWSNYNTNAGNSQGCIAAIIYSFDPNDDAWHVGQDDSQGRILWMMALPESTALDANTVALTMVYDVSGYAEPKLYINGTDYKYDFKIGQESDIYDWMIVFNWVGNGGDIECELNIYKRIPANSPSNPSHIALEWNTHLSSNGSAFEMFNILYSDWEGMWKAGYVSNEPVEWDMRSLYIGGNSKNNATQDVVQWKKFPLRLAMFRERQ